MRILKFLLLGLMAVPMSVQAETAMLMAEEPGCIWCARWNAEIAHIYPKTPEGQAAPLSRFDIHDGPPDGVTLDSRVRFTPTFILVRDGLEVGRIEGYPGEDFFWFFLARVLEEADVDLTESAQ